MITQQLSLACIMYTHSQTEGALSEGGRSASVWDVFTQQYPDKIRDGSNASVTCDFYNRYPEDIALMQQLGIKNYR